MGPVFALHRLVWRRHRDGWLWLPGADPVRTFADRATAEATARDLEWDLRAGSTRSAAAAPGCTTRPRSTPPDCSTGAWTTASTRRG